MAWARRWSFGLALGSIFFAMVLAMMLALAGCPASGADTTPTDRRGDVNGRLFEFSTAGSEHTDSYGAWLVRVRGDGMWIAQVKDGETKEFGPFVLADDDARKLWRLIDDLDVLSRSSKNVRSRRTPIYQVTLLKPPKVNAYTVVIPMEKGIKEAAVADLVDELGTLIKKYASESAVLTPQDDG